jgi:hypothetical protein
MSTYSPSLRIELINTGDQAGTWGTTTNTNMGTLIESAVAGYVSVSITSANQALTALNGAADQSRNMTLALTTTTTAAFNVYAPPAEKTYVIYNTSLYTATIYNSTVLGNTTAAGTGVSIPAGKTMTVWSDGTNFALQNTHIVGTVVGDVTGNLTGNVTGNVTGNTNGVVTAAAGSTAVTATFGDNDTSIATTAFVQAALQALHPVGSIYINAGVTTNPATLFGFGTWVAFGAGRVMVGLNGSDPLFDTLEETGGSKDAIVVSHTHTGTTDSAGNHQHFVAQNQQRSGYPGSPTTTSSVADKYFGGGPTNEAYIMAPGTGNADVGLSSTAGDHTHPFTTGSAGSSGTNANLQPYITVAMWKRTA